MYSIRKIPIFVLIMICNLPVFSQEIVELPMSIYSPKMHFTIFDMEQGIKDELYSMGYPFLMVDIDDIKSNLFTVSFNNIGKTPTNFVFESYQKIIFNETDKYYDPNKLAILPSYKN